MVTTFQLGTDDEGPLREMARHATMAEASAQLPDGAYTTFRTYQRHRVLRLSQHLRRLEESLALRRQSAPPINDLAARTAIGQIIALLNYAESRFRLTYAADGLFISIEPFVPYPQSLYDDGVWCVSVPLSRNTPHAKSTAFIASAADAYRALPASAHEGLMIADDGAVLEGLSSNFFAVVETHLRTEEARVLIGVTRLLVLEVARGVLPVSTDAVRHDNLSKVSECFITSVSREIMPVVKIDEIVIGDGKPGPVTRELMQRFRELVEREAEALS